MLYEFIDLETGGIVDIPFAMKDAPALDEVIDFEGRKLKRIVSGTVAGKVPEFQPFASEQIIRDHPDAPNLDKDGRCAFKTQQEVDRFTKKNPGMTWDG